MVVRKKEFETLGSLRGKDAWLHEILIIIIEPEGEKGLMCLCGDRLFFPLFVMRGFPRCDEFYFTAHSGQYCFLPKTAQKLPFGTYCMTQIFLKLEEFVSASNQILMRTNFHSINFVFHQAHPRMKSFQHFSRFRLMNDSTMRPLQWMMETVVLIHIPAGTCPLDFHC